MKVLAFRLSANRMKIKRHVVRANILALIAELGQIWAVYAGTWK
jgi:hypothetical protein